MEVKQGQVFNLWNTNGRRSDILNALKIYLQILQEIRAEYPYARWGAYPESVAQFVFYERAVEYSPDVFKKHTIYDAFLDKLGNNREAFLARRKTPMDIGLTIGDMQALDEGIELRARNYTSNLVKIGFADAERNISDVGLAFLEGYADRDELERILPIDNVNLLLLRQLLKFKVFSSPTEEGERTFYSPFHIALLVLLQNGTLDKNTLLAVVQGIDPYLGEEERSFILDHLCSPTAIEALVWNKGIDIPAQFSGNEQLSFERFSCYIKNQRGDNAVDIYYEFYKNLIAFRENICDETCARLLNHVSQNKTKLYKAFGCGRSPFQWDGGEEVILAEFLKQNKTNELLFGEHFNKEFYRAYCRSKRADGIWEYSDTTERMLGATGIFKFSPLADLSFRDILACLFDEEFLCENTFGTVSEEEYQKRQAGFESNLTLTDILGYSKETVGEITAKVGTLLGETTPAAIRAKVRSKTADDFARHIEEKYPRDKISQLLPLFSDRSNDARIKKAVNDTASVPTIYEYIIGIAWYYISGRDFDLYESMKLTLNADFEPVVHAGGGDGDIVIQYDDLAVMLEVTLMNKQAQKRGEWEPVLRHSLNLKAANEGKETVTYFIADELDYNTVNIWRAVAAVPLESTGTHQMVNGVMIMPFTNGELLDILNAEIQADHILAAVKSSFEQIPRITDTEWKDDILAGLGVGAQR